MVIERKTQRNKRNYYERKQCEQSAEINENILILKIFNFITDL